MTDPDDTIRVLHVEDDPEFASLVATRLARESDRIALDTVTDAEAALTALGIGTAAETASDATHDAETASETVIDGGVDCIVSDYDMPGRNGIEFLERVREDRPELPFVLYTGKGSEEVASDAIAAGVTDYLRKGHGSDHYALLANRIENAVEQVRSARRAERYQRINTVVRRINEALARATDRSEIGDRVCEILADAEPYRFAWIGEHDADAGTVEPRCAAGTDPEYLDAITITADDDPTGRGPTGRAIRERELAVIQNIPEDPRYEPWRDAALERGYRSSAAVPLVHDDTLYGVLNVYADRTHAFDGPERQLLSNLGDTIAHAHHHVELQRQYADQYRTLFEEAPVMVAFTRSTDGEPIIEDCNRAFAERLGYTPEELRETPLTDYYTEASADRLHGESGYQRALSGEFVHEQRTLETRDGEEVLTVLRASPRRNREGDVVGTHALYLDITDERQIRELERANTLLATLLDSLPQGVLVEDESREILRVNRRLMALFGFEGSPDELVGVDCARLAETTSDAFADPERFRERTETLVAERTPVDREEYVLTDGRAFERSYRPIELPDGGGNLWVYRDVTDERDRTAEMREIKERYEAFVEHSSDVITVLDEAGRITYESPAVERILGYEPSARTGDPVFEYVHPDDREAVRKRFSRLVEGDAGVTERVEYRFEHADGSWVWIESIGADRTETAIGGYVVNSREIAERKRHERELERRNERLAEFASVLSHDLRNPLNVAQGRLDLVRHECETDHIEPIARAHDRMESLIEDLLTLAREGSAVTDPKPVALATLLENCWATVRTPDASIVVDVDRTIRGEESRLRQVFENLFRNAVEHGGEDVTVTVGELDDGFYVADDGPGIPASERDDVFEAGHSSSPDGTGFGLSIVERIVEAHGWDIRVTAGADGGARFEVTGVEFVTE